MAHATFMATFDRKNPTEALLPNVLSLYLHQRDRYQMFTHDAQPSQIRTLQNNEPKLCKIVRVYTL